MNSPAVIVHGALVWRAAPSMLETNVLQVDLYRVQEKGNLRGFAVNSPVAVVELTPAQAVDLATDLLEAVRSLGGVQ